ncbi:response regulator transcription factor [Nannocystis pusilla]|uniref:Response regulator transcription factor n=1 Tax=Nannocystis pusilla TaxID=889268 RepID=A0A9X3IUE5_9BACT|nr:response regulator transcription factor [Nannocystis pusilla]MCY1004316.1 response regulator transcription factor [Nannocystis pusilla]
MTTTNSTQRIFLIDDHPVFRHGLRQLLEAESGLAVCGEAEDAPGALASLQAGDLPDLALVDVSLPSSGGIDLVRRLRVLHPQLRCLVVSMHDEHLYAERAVRAGAVGYITKALKPKAMVAEIRKALRGELALSEGAATMLLRSAYGGERRESRYANLSDRELEVFELIGRGMKAGAISEALCISTKTVERHQAGIKQKLGVAHTSELRRIAAIWLSESSALTP